MKYRVDTDTGIQTDIEADAVYSDGYALVLTRTTDGETSVVGWFSANTAPSAYVRES